MTTRRTFLGAAAALAGLPVHDEAAGRDTTSGLPDVDDLPKPERGETTTYTDYGYADMTMEADAAELRATSLREPDGRGGEYVNAGIEIEMHGVQFGVSMDVEEARAFAKELLAITEKAEDDPPADVLEDATEGPA
jgi:hypothetical protein